MRFRQLLPEPGIAEVAELLASLRALRDSAPGSRPYTMVNFVASADGRATFRGRSGQLGDEGDKRMFHGLREQADAVMVGTGTLRVERYGRMLRKAERRERRVALGRSAEPLACIVTRSGELPADIPMLAEPEARVVVFAPTEIDLDAFAAQLTLVRLDPGEMTLSTVMRILRTEHDVRLLLCEGGPTLFGALLHEQLVDELFLTLAPKLTGGGTGSAITAGAELAEPAALVPVWLLERGGAIYARYALGLEHGHT